MTDANKGLRLYNTLTRTKEDFRPIDPLRRPPGAAFQAALAVVLAGFFFGVQMSAATIAAGPMARYCLASDGAFSAARSASLFFGDISLFPKVMVFGCEGLDMVTQWDQIVTGSGFLAFSPQLMSGLA